MLVLAHLLIKRSTVSFELTKASRDMHFRLSSLKLCLIPEQMIDLVWFGIWFGFALFIQNRQLAPPFSAPLGVPGVGREAQSLGDGRPLYSLGPRV